MKVCIIGASGKLGKYMIRHCLDRGYEVVGVCREESVAKLNEFEGKIKIFPGRTNEPEVISEAVAGCEGVLCVLVPWGVESYSSGTAKAVLDHAQPNARLIFSCGWHISRDGKDSYSKVFLWLIAIFGFIARLLRFADIDDQVKACDLIFQSERKWTVVRCSNIEEGESEGLPVWSEHVGDEILSDNITRRIDFALFMVEALNHKKLIHKAPAISANRAGRSAINASF